MRIIWHLSALAFLFLLIAGCSFFRDDSAFFIGTWDLVFTNVIVTYQTNAPTNSTVVLYSSNMVTPGMFSFTFNSGGSGSYNGQIISNAVSNIVTNWFTNNVTGSPFAYVANGYLRLKGSPTNTGYYPPLIEDYAYRYFTNRSAMELRFEAGYTNIFFFQKR